MRVTDGPGPDDRRALDAVGLEERLRAVVGPGARVAVVPRSPSTSTDVADELRADPTSWPDRSVLVADHQDAGRGRRGRTWTTPPGTAVTLSVVLRPGVRQDRWGWLALIAGLATVDAVHHLTGLRTGLKWPNDVLVLPDGVSGEPDVVGADRPAGDQAADDVPGWDRSRKVAGVLGEVVPVADGGPPVAVVGIGLNVDQQAHELPVPWATSLTGAAGRTTAAGGVPSREDLAVALVRELVALDDAWRAAGGDPVAAGIADRCTAACRTLGTRVRVDLPDGRQTSGVARSLGPDGSLEVVTDDGAVQAVLAGDVHHVRPSR